MFLASDNSGPLHPSVMDRVIAANTGHQMPYGNDVLMDDVRAQVRNVFEAPDAAVYLVSTGTAANALALSTLAKPWDTIFCTPLAHIHVDECHAPEFYTGGGKLSLVGDHDKMTPQELETAIIGWTRGDVHTSQRGPLALTQVTERGRVYSIEELKDLTAVAKSHGLSTHMDGARFANAIVALGCTPAEMTWQQGIDVLCFGGTKNGLAIGEAVIFFNKALAEDFDYRCKQAGQLASKMRFVSAPLVGVLEDNVWLHHARHANDCAAYLSSQLAQIAGVERLFPTQANGVFVELPTSVIQSLQNQGWHFYTFIGSGGARFMCSWNTTRDRIDALVTDIKNAMAAAAD